MGGTGSGEEEAEEEEGGHGGLDFCGSNAHEREG